MSNDHPYPINRRAKALKDASFPERKTHPTIAYAAKKSTKHPAPTQPRSKHQVVTAPISSKVLDEIKARIAELVSITYQQSLRIGQLEDVVTSQTETIENQEKRIEDLEAKKQEKPSRRSNRRRKPKTTPQGLQDHSEKLGKPARAARWKPPIKGAIASRLRPRKRKTAA